MRAIYGATHMKGSKNEMTILLHAQAMKTQSAEAKTMFPLSITDPVMFTHALVAARDDNALQNSIVEHSFTEVYRSNELEDADQETHALLLGALSEMVGLMIPMAELIDSTCGKRTFDSLIQASATAYQRTNP